MEEKYHVPVAAMLGGIGVWIAFLVWYAVAGAPAELSPWLEAGLCFAAGGLVVFFGFR
jgi:hypothetical protein